MKTFGENLVFFDLISVLRKMTFSYFFFSGFWLKNWAEGSVGAWATGRFLVVGLQRMGQGLTSVVGC